MADKQQITAINHESGPALILAGPGSGKTYVLTHHISFLINSLGVSPDKILVLTFTREAAKNMKVRFMSLSEKKADDIVFGTFHSVFYRILCHCSGKKYKIIDSIKSKKYISEIIDKSSDLEEVASLISKYKSIYPTPDLLDFQSSYANFPKVFKEYQDLLFDRDELDYDDILLTFHDYLIKNDVKRVELLKRFQFVLIDEFQDISLLQYEIIKKITLSYGHVFAVGDEDQSIYGFRGATKDVLRRFLDDYKDVTLIELKTNYRSTSEIVERAYKLISNNTGRLSYNKQNTLCSNENSFKLTMLSKESDIFNCINTNLCECENEGLHCAVLLRTNKDVERYKKVLLKKNSNDYKQIRDDIFFVFHNYLCFDFYNNREAFFSILNIPERFLETALFYDKEIDIDAVSKRTKNLRIRMTLSKLKTELVMLKKCIPVAFCVYLWKVCGLKEFFYEKYTGYDEVGKCFDDLMEIAKKCKSKKDLIDCLNVKEEESNEDRSLQIMTYHASKGLEFDAVFLPELVEGHVPGRASVLQAGIEEERRLFYVAMTRAKKKLYIYSCEDFENHSVLPSRFVNEMK